MYCAIIGDIIDSRSIENREILQEKYKKIFESINDEFNEDIASYFKIRDGDGFHGLLKNPANLFNIIIKIRLAIVPHQVRIGIGFGDIATKIDKNNVQDIDGSAYSLARDALDYMSEKKNKYKSVYQTTMIKTDSKPLDSETMQTCSTYENLINTVLNACSSIEKNWDNIHAETIQKKMDNMTQVEIAKDFGISQSAVNKRIALANYYTYDYYINNINSAVRELWEKVNNV